MSKIECPNCAMDVPANSKNCPICGNKLENQPKWVQWVALAMALLLLLTWILR